MSWPRCSTSGGSVLRGQVSDAVLLLRARLGPDIRVDGGSMHFRCWEEHHSDPTMEWPVGHECRATSDDAGREEMR